MLSNTKIGLIQRLLEYVNFHLFCFLCPSSGLKMPKIFCLRVLRFEFAPSFIMLSSGQEIP